MNLIDAKVTKLLTEPYFIKTPFYEFWVVEVEFVDMGGHGKDHLDFKTKKEAEKIKVGHIYQH